MTYDETRIRIECAELVGWKRLKAHSGKVYLVHPLTSQFAYALSCGEGETNEAVSEALKCPNFPSSADAALTLVAWMAKPENGGWQFIANNMSGCDGGEWCVQFVNADLDDAMESAPTLPLAICLAFLRANSVNLEEMKQ